MFPLSSQRKHICKENEPPKEIPLAWYFFFFFKQNLLGRVSTPLLLHSSSNHKPISLMTKWQYTVFLLQDTESVRALNQPTHPPTNTCKVSTTVQVPWEQGRGGPLLHGQKMHSAGVMGYTTWQRACWVSGLPGGLCLSERQGKPPTEVMCNHAVTSVVSDSLQPRGL